MTLTYEPEQKLKTEDIYHILDFCFIDRDMVLKSIKFCSHVKLQHYSTALLYITLLYI